MLTSRDHPATSTLYTLAIFTRVLAYPLPANYHQARRGLIAFLFHRSVPPSSPSSINVGNRLTQIRYDIRASVDVAWKIQKFPESPPANKTMVYTPSPHQNVWSSASDKIWAQARVLGGMPMAGESACIESSKRQACTSRSAGTCVYLRQPKALARAAAAATDLGHPRKHRLSRKSTQPTREPGVLQFVFDAPRSARTVSAHPRHGGDADEDEGETIAVKK
ncbi:hypothetical protein EDB85DRAFT_2156876 [Lactarius pseudohatsudake]|nr:hypothetical protein EDB85DRAFT_2156876 [Lactarius pseudohatsudake]